MTAKLVAKERKGTLIVGRRSSVVGRWSLVLGRWSLVFWDVGGLRGAVMYVQCTHVQAMLKRVLCL